MQSKNIWFWVKTILIALLIAWFLRTFFVESYRVPVCSMENTLLEGDRIFVNKLSYGIRLPMTVLSIPFVQDSILGMKSYSTALEFPYKRFFEKKVSKNDVVIFNDPINNLQLPIDKRKISISRCLALPGDTLAFRDNMLYVNNEALVQSPNVVEPYYYEKINEDLITGEMKHLQIPDRGVTTVDSLNVRLLSRYETFLLKQEIDGTIQINVLRPTYEFIVPSKGEKIEINDENYYVYLPIITAIEGKEAKYEDNALWIDGEEVESFEFTKDYYWMLPDNRAKYVEVNVAAFVPETHIIGKAERIWNRGFQKIR